MQFPRRVCSPLPSQGQEGLGSPFLLSYVWSDDSSPFPVLLISEGAPCEVSAGPRATPSVASQQKSGSWSLMFMSQECGFKLGFSLGLENWQVGTVKPSERLVMDQLPHPEMGKASVVGRLHIWRKKYGQACTQAGAGGYSWGCQKHPLPASWPLQGLAGAGCSAQLPHEACCPVSSSPPYNSEPRTVFSTPHVA